MSKVEPKVSVESLEGGNKKVVKKITTKKLTTKKSPAKKPDTKKTTKK